ncbi:MAG: TlpA family protein disulfide reductase [Gammaproteobacteria bacterium]|nr:TlpA family protein disulfide reductase [Gammaproteobacteria bacterium]
MEIFVSVLLKPLFLTLFIISFFFSTASYAAKAPTFILKGDNGTISLKKLRGKVVYVDFWASWCIPCRKSFPWMNEMQKKYKSKGLVVIGINLDEDKSAAQNFLKQVPANFTIAYDPDGVTPGKYKVEVMPTSYLIDRSGNLVYTHRGFKKSYSEKMENKITALLGK